jgi:hypothetical protein
VLTSHWVDPEAQEWADPVHQHPPDESPVDEEHHHTAVEMLPLLQLKPVVVQFVALFHHAPFE